MNVPIVFIYQLEKKLGQLPPPCSISCYTTGFHYNLSKKNPTFKNLICQKVGGGGVHLPCSLPPPTATLIPLVLICVSVDGEGGCGIWDIREEGTCFPCILPLKQNLATLVRNKIITRLHTICSCFIPQPLYQGISGSDPSHYFMHGCHSLIHS